MILKPVSSPAFLFITNDAPPKYYPRAIANEQKDLMSLAQTIARNTTMGVADIHGVLLALEEEIMDD